MRGSGESYDSYRDEEKKLDLAVARIRESVADLGPTLVIERSLLPTTPFTGNDLFIAIGQDGLVANILRYSGDLPILGVNPDPGSYEGALLNFSVDSAIAYLSISRVAHECEPITLAEGRFSNGAVIRAANDIFVGKADHSSALYKIQHGSRAEQHSSSGIIISTPMGATGWQRSVIEGSLRTLQSITGKSPGDIRPKPLSRDSSRLRFWVREPWPSVNSSSNVVAGIVTSREPLVIISQMGENGTVFADGMQADSYAFRAGETLTVQPGIQKGRLVRAS